MELCYFTLEKYIYGQEVPHLANWAGIRSGPVESRIAEITGIADHIIKGLTFIHDLREVHRDLSLKIATLNLGNETGIKSCILPT